MKDSSTETLEEEEDTSKITETGKDTMANQEDSLEIGAFRDHTPGGEQTTETIPSYTEETEDTTTNIKTIGW